MTKSVLALGVALASLLGSVGVAAAPVAFNFSGVSNGSSFGGTITYDTTPGTILYASNSPYIDTVTYQRQFTLSNTYGQSALTTTNAANLQVSDSKSQFFTDAVTFGGDLFSIFFQADQSSFSGTGIPDFSQLSRLSASAYVDGGYVGVTISQATALPEAATWAMMILGMGAVGYAMRRRQKVRVRYAA